MYTVPPTAKEKSGDIKKEKQRMRLRREGTPENAASHPLSPNSPAKGLN